MEVEASGSSQGNPQNERNDEIHKLFAIVDIIIKKMSPIVQAELVQNCAEGKVDIDLSDEIAGVLMTTYTCLRKEENDHRGHGKYKEYSTSIRGATFTIGSVVAAIKEANIKLDFLVATPIVEIMTLFKAFFDEVRTGVTRFKVRESFLKQAVKRDSMGRAKTTTIKIKEASQNINQYGLVNHHIPLLQGITLAPERRTGIIRSIGPLAQCILMVMEDKYYTKLTSALQTSLQMLPMVNEIISCLKEANSPGKVAGVLKELGDILLMTTARSTQKIYLPLLLIRHMWSQKPADVAWSFSGASMLKYYSDFIIRNNVKFIIKSGADQGLTSQVIFHACFGTYLDDLDILSTITNYAGAWGTRKEMNSVFTKKASQRVLEVTPITFRMVSKMAQALLTKSLGNVDPQATNRPSFSGFRKRTFTQEFMSYLSTGKTAISFSTDPTHLQFALKKLKDSLMLERDGGKLEMAGTTKWEVKNGNNWVESEEIPVEGVVKFYGAPRA